MKSVRLGHELEEQLTEASRVSGLPASQIIREAVRERCDSILGECLASRIADVIGVVGSGGGASRDTGKQLTQLLKKRRRTSRR